MGEKLKYRYTHIIVWLASILIFIAVVYFVATAQRDATFSSESLTKEKISVIEREFFGNAAKIAGLLAILVALVAIGGSAMRNEELSVSAEPGMREV